MRDQQKAFLILGSFLIVVLVGFVVFARLTAPAWFPIDNPPPNNLSTESVIENNYSGNFPADQFLNTSTNIPDAERILVFRRGSDLILVDPNTKETSSFVRMPSRVTAQSDQFIIQAVGSGVYVRGQFENNLQEQTVFLSLTGTIEAAENPCLPEKNDAFLFKKRLCSLNGSRAAVINERPLEVTDSFLLTSYNDGIQNKQLTVSGKIGAARERIPLTVSALGKEVFIASVGEHGGYYGLSRINTDTGAENYYDVTLSDQKKPASDIRVSADGGSIALLLNHQAEYAFTESYCTVSDDGGSEIWTLNPNSSKQEQLYVLDGYIDNMAISENGQYIAAHSFTNHPLCRESTPGDGKTDIINSASGDIKEVTGDIIAWVDRDTLLLKNTTKSVYSLYHVSTDTTEIINGIDRTYFVGAIFRK